MAMASATCPSCGVAVMPGYARCPKCRRPLPRRATTQMSGGTAVEDTRRWPLFVAIGGVALAVGIFIWVSGGKSSDKPAAAPSVVQPTTEPTTQPQTIEPQQPFADQPTTTQQQPTGPDPGALASALERDLKRQRLWSNVTVSGTRVEVRSGSCTDPAMAPALDGAAAGFKAAGLTKLRCVEQSGRVVTDRDL